VGSSLQLIMKAVAVVRVVDMIAIIMMLDVHNRDKVQWGWCRR